MTTTPVQLKAYALTFMSQCVGCLQSSHYLWDASGVALTDESTSDGFCHPCWND